jgi:hypothetical protein
LNFEFWSFSRPVECHMILSFDAGQWQIVAAPSQPCDQRYSTVDCAVNLECLVGQEC